MPDIIPGPEERDAATCAAACRRMPTLADLTWFRVGGPAQVLFAPADEDDLAYFLARLPIDVSR